jgi:hypothetical protein
MSVERFEDARQRLLDALAAFSEAVEAMEPPKRPEPPPSPRRSARWRNR